METTVSTSFHPENLPSAIAELRSDGKLPTLSSERFDGGECRIYKANFDDDDSWAIRLPIHVRNASQDDILSLLKTEIFILQELERKGFRWSPRLKASSLTFENGVGFPFLALQWIPGECLRWSADVPGTRALRDKILGQVAHILVSLVECTSENRGSATKRFERIIDQKIDRIRAGSLNEITEQDCFAQKKFLAKVLYPELDDAPFAIDHGNLSPGNIIVDSEYNVTGIIDWAFGNYLPVQVAGGLPRFLTTEEPPKLGSRPSLVLQEDRRSFIASLKTASTSLRSSQLVTWVLRVHCDEDVDDRRLFLEGITSKGVHRWLAEEKWGLPLLVRGS